jgi:tetraacyldisaccharide 4'-kinase
MNPNRRNKFRYFLAPLAIPYGLVAEIRNKLFDLNILPSKEFNLPVISIGNITAGGTGKTPHIEYIIALLKDEFNIATLSRGYKRKTKQFQYATLESTYKDIGDEPRQIKQKFRNIIVAVDNSRVHGIEKLTTDFKYLKVILLDDAFQHRYVKPGLSILLIDFNRPLSKDHLLPFGMLRENPHEKRRAHIIIVTKCPPELKPIDRRLVVKDLSLFPYQNLFFTTVKYGDLYPVFGDIKNLLSKEICKKEKYGILMVTGIANGRLFKKHLRGISPKIRELNFPDHYQYNYNDIQTIAEKFGQIENDKKIIITTEKDAMRFQYLTGIVEEIRNYLYYIPISVDFLFNDTENFDNQIIGYVKKNKRDSILFKKQD